MNIQTGTPSAEGLYVVFSTGLVGYTERELVMWYKGAWHYRFSSELFRDPVFGWIGPLPHNFLPNNSLMSKAAAPAQEFDL